MDNTATTDRTPACNSGFAKKRVQWLIEHSTSHQILWYVDSFVLRNPLLRKAKTLQATLKDDSANIKRTEKRTTKCQRFAKIKRAASRHTSQRFCSTFNFAQPHPKPTHHPTSGRLTI
jgi:uncharacterized protein (DUF2461 family)